MPSMEMTTDKSRDLHSIPSSSSGGWEEVRVETGGEEGGGSSSGGQEYEGGKDRITQSHQSHGINKSNSCPPPPSSPTTTTTTTTTTITTTTLTSYVPPYTSPPLPSTLSGYASVDVTVPYSPLASGCNGSCNGRGRPTSYRMEEEGEMVK